MKAILALLTLVSSNLLYAEVVQISVAEYPPMATQKKLEGIGYGLHRDMANAIVNAAGYKARFHFKPFKRVSNDFGKADDIVLTSRLTLIGHGHDRDTFYSISLGFIYNHYFYFKSQLPTKVHYSKPVDLRPYSVCLQIGSHAAGLLTKAGVRVHRVVKTQQCLKKLVLGRDDLWGTSALSANYYTNKFFPEKLIDLTHTDVTATSTDELLVALIKNKKNKAIFTKLTASYKTLISSGALLDIIQKYWPEQVPQRILPIAMKN